MHKESKDENNQQGNLSLPPGIIDKLDELSDVWRELLGSRAHARQLSTLPGDAPIPTLEVDPWSALLQANGVEVVDLQHIHLQISDQEVEQILQVMPNDPDTSPQGSSDDARNSSRRKDKH